MLPSIDLRLRMLDVNVALSCSQIRKCRVRETSLTLRERLIVFQEIESLVDTEGNVREFLLESLYV